jgi:hypothetical protein
MESSTVLAFRIFVMLSCLIVVPMAAIFGSAFPDVVKSVLVDRIVAWGTGKPVESTRSNSADDGFSEVKSGENSHAAHGRGGQWEAPRWGTPGGDAGNWQSAPGVSQASGVVPAGATGALQSAGDQSASFVGNSETARGAGSVYSIQRAASDEPHRQQPLENPPASQQAIAPADQAVHAAVPVAANPMEQPDRFTAMERKLREYGAVYYLLETWGNEGELYRFHCRMSIANNPNYTRHFEATDRDALKAMSQVLARVEAWRAGRLQ